MDLTPELAALAVRRITALREQKDLDPDIDETYYWAYLVDCYFDPWAESSVDDKKVEGTGVAVRDMLEELQIEEKEVVCVPESFLVPPSQSAAVECEEMIVRQYVVDNIRIGMLMWHWVGSLEENGLGMTYMFAQRSRNAISPLY